MCDGAIRAEKSALTAPFFSVILTHMNHICEELHRCESHKGVDLPGVDILIVGGGVNGLAVAREAQVRGWSATVVEADDIGAGTSGTSSRLVHGGVRYLENLEFHLVRESLKERERLLFTAPHLVQPYPLLIPFYKHNRRHGFVLRLGMVLYDVLSFDKSTPLHRTFSKTRVQQAYPGLDSKDLYGAALYYDAQAANTERLCVEQALDIVALGGSVRNHTRVTGLTEQASGISVSMFDSLTETHYTQTAAIVVNAAGPWVDRVLGLSKTASSQLIGGTKGSHLTVGPFPGAPSTGVHFEATSDGRAILVLPLPDGNYLVGATDIFFEGDPGSAVMSDEEIDYLISEVNRLVPAAHLLRSDVLHTVSGVRPLPFSPKAKSAAQVSRSHHLVAHPAMSGLFSITGGKLTTHRALGEMAINKLQSRPATPGAPGRRRLLSQLFNPSASTRRLKLPGARSSDLTRFTSSFRRTTSLPAASIDRLLGLYGVRVERLEQLVASRPELAATLPGRDDAIAAEVVMAVQDEFARTLTDIVARRLLLVWNDDAGLDSLDGVAAVAAQELGWDQAQIDREIASYRDWIRLRRPAAYEPDASIAR
ncbi:glycerol-3-phosphate dehydrogenase [Salinibacterium xinjiangense]|uniref:Glycerol-3-phosphate dehydrogenase n=2 Tax=Salinibacterium xinjiangense TaxID=386302 RepID=A0A2C8Y5S5_9MICO|nr:glycerol-3-phosphate dehydrogenase [Salinibacterium xinjiangense]